LFNSKWALSSIADTCTSIFMMRTNLQTSNHVLAGKNVTLQWLMGWSYISESQKLYIQTTGLCCESIWNFVLISQIWVSLVTFILSVKLKDNFWIFFCKKLHIVNCFILYPIPQNFRSLRITQRDNKKQGSTAHILLGSIYN
jgi:hypothetical protein